MMTNYQYFSGANVSVQIDDEPLVECAGISYVVQSSSQPVYSYASTKFDLMLNGREMIQGNFLVNYTEPDNVLRKISGIWNTDIKIKDLSESFSYYFDIEIQFGDNSNPNFEMNKQIIKDCRIISRGKTIQISDQVLLEEYTFIGRNIEIHSK
tara:strand:- start:208 stop:666 length:459 start_codon:yes stop_codon:yes gene_type:complete